MVLWVDTEYSVICLSIKRGRGWDWLPLYPWNPIATTGPSNSNSIGGYCTRVSLYALELRWFFGLLFWFGPSSRPKRISFVLLFSHGFFLLLFVIQQSSPPWSPSASLLARVPREALLFLFFFMFGSLSYNLKANLVQLLSVYNGPFWDPQNSISFSDRLEFLQQLLLLSIDLKL